jgi:hypothetical protein
VGRHFLTQTYKHHSSALVKQVGAGTVDLARYPTASKIGGRHWQVLYDTCVIHRCAKCAKWGLFLWSGSKLQGSPTLFKAKAPTQTTPTACPAAIHLKPMGFKGLQKTAKRILWGIVDAPLCLVPSSNSVFFGFPVVKRCI